jgi:uncharacterized FlaG/YvyC family protein
MEAGNINKPAAALVSGQGSETSQRAERDSLPKGSGSNGQQGQAVQFAPDSEAMQRAKIAARVEEFITRNMTTDPKTREVVYQTVNQKTGEVVRQFPDDAILKLRAYTKELNHSEIKPVGLKRSV